MPCRIFTFIVGCVVALALGAVAVDRLSPSFAGTVDAFFREHVLGWNEPACRSNPAPCLRSKYETLADREQNVAAATDLLRSEEARLLRIIEERETIRAKNASFLRDGRDLVVKAEANPATPVTFAGRTYPDAATLRRQLHHLWAEQADLARATAEARDLQGRISEQRKALTIQHENLRAARQLIPGKLALLRGNQVRAEFDENISMIKQALTTSESSLHDANNLIGSTRQLVESEAGRRNTGANRNELDRSFEDFLKGAAPSNP